MSSTVPSTGFIMTFQPGSASTQSLFLFFGKHENCNVVKALIEVMLLERIPTVTVYGRVVPSSFLTNNDKSLRSLDG